MAVMQLLVMVPFALMMFLLVLYVTHRFDFTTGHAYSLIAAFIALIYGAHVSGGFMAEKFFGHTNAIFLGIILSMVGIFGLLLPGVITLYISLSFFIVGSGLLIPCLYVLLGRLYERDNPYRPSGFLFVYVGMNIGTFIGLALSGPLLQSLGFKYVFVVGGIADILLLFIFSKYKTVFSDHAVNPDHSFYRKRDKLLGSVVCLISIVLIAVLLDYAQVANVALVIIGILCVIFMLFLASKQRGKARSNMFGFLILTIVALFFWALYMLNTSAVIIFAEHNVDRHLFNWTIPTSTFSSLNPVFILIVGIALIYFWNLRYRKTGKSPSIPAKFAIGLVFAGAAYLLLVFGIHHEVLNKVSIIWVILFYFMMTVAELFIAPVGFSMVGKLVPMQYEALMVGVWELSTGIAGALSGYLAYFTISPVRNGNNLVATNLSYEHSFIIFGIIACSLGVIVAFFVPWLNRLCESK